MSKPFAVFDIDGTLIRWQLYHAVVDSLVKHGYIGADAYGEVKEARMLWKRRTHSESFKDYERRLISTYESLIGRLPVTQFDEAVQEVFDEYKDQVYIYTRDLIQSLKAKGYMLLAISGSQIEVVEKIVKYYGFDECVGTVYEQVDGHFTGKVEIGSRAKDVVLEQMIQKHDLATNGSIAVGDSESDIAMLKMVEQPIAFNPEKKLFDHAKQQGWKIVLERKNMVYELERVNGQYVLV